MADKNCTECRGSGWVEFGEGHGRGHFPCDCTRASCPAPAPVSGLVAKWRFDASALHVLDDAGEGAAIRALRRCADDLETAMLATRPTAKEAARDGEDSGCELVLRAAKRIAALHTRADWENFIDKDRDNYLEMARAALNIAPLTATPSPPAPVGLPEPTKLFRPATNASHGAAVYAYTADQLRAYGEACRAAAPAVEPVAWRMRDACGFTGRFHDIDTLPPKTLAAMQEEGISIEYAYLPAAAPSEPEVSEAMVREALHFCPDSVQGQPARWRWIAKHITAALRSRP